MLTVPAGALSADATITMTVYGTDLNTLIVAFQPSGLVFNVKADMEIDLGDNLAPQSDISKITPYHLYEDGTTAPVEIYYIDRSAYAIKIFCKVPSFSRYELRDGI